MKFLQNLFTPEPAKKHLYDAFTQGEREAIVDLLLLSIYSDNHISYAESVELEDSIKNMGWESDIPSETYIQTATARARSARISETATNDFLEFIATRLESPPAKTRALELLDRLLASDGTSDSEKAFFKTVEAKLN